MKKIFLLSLLLCGFPVLAQDVGKCQKTLGVTWADIVECIDALRIQYPDQFQGAAFGYIPSGAVNPTIATVGPAFADTYEGPRILWQGSVSKPFTHLSSLIALEGAGIPVDTYLANVGVARDNFINGDPYGISRAFKETITLRQVLTMTAGFGEFSYDYVNAHPWKQPWEPAFFDSVASGSAACFQNATLQSDHKFWLMGEPGLYNECVFAPSQIGNPSSPYVWKHARSEPLFRLAFYMMRYPLAQAPIIDNPYGPDIYRLGYSNESSILAAWLTEGRTGQTYNNHIKSNIFTPAGMTDSFFNPVNFSTSPLALMNEGVTQGPRNRVAHMINKANGVRDTNNTPRGLALCNGLYYWCDIRDWFFTWPEGGLYSTPRDLMTFMRHVRDRTLPLSPAIYDLITTDQLRPDQATDGSRTAAFAYARNGHGNFIDMKTEGSFGHNGYPGASMWYDKQRNLIWYFGTQRVMRHHSEDPAKRFFQANPETFAEARLYHTLLTSMLENVKPENLNFFFDANRAVKRNQRVLRYASRPIDANGNPVGAYQDAYRGCMNESDDCDYTGQQDYAVCTIPGSSDPDGINDNQWYDLSPNQRTMTVFPQSASPACRWVGTGSVTDNNPANQQTGPFRLELKNGASARVTSSIYSNSYTIALWIRPHSTAAASIISRTGSTGGTTYHVGIQNGRFIHSSWDASGAKKTVVGDPVVVNRWYNVVARATKFGNLSLFIDGRQVGGNVPIGDFVSIASGEYKLGAPADGLGAFNGDLAVVGVYTQELSQQDITRNCNGLKYRYGITCN